MNATPGPWNVHVGRDPNTESLEVLILGGETEPGRQDVVSIVVLNDQDETMHNAHLISAAPELLSSLERFVNLFALLPQDPNDPEVYETARHAIRKARGDL